MYDPIRCNLRKIFFENNYFQILLMFCRQRHAALCKRIAQQIDNVIASQATLAAHAFTGMTGPPSGRRIVDATDPPSSQRTIEKLFKAFMDTPDEACLNEKLLNGSGILARAHAADLRKRMSLSASRTAIWCESQWGEPAALFRTEP